MEILSNPKVSDAKNDFFTIADNYYMYFEILTETLRSLKKGDFEIDQEEINISIKLKDKILNCFTDFLNSVFMPESLEATSHYLYMKALSSAFMIFDSNICINTLIVII